MSHPTEMTVATGTVTYSGDPESDERIRSREVRVSVTYRIDEDEETDLADLAHEKMAEVERARMAAQERIGNMDGTGGTERMERDQADPYGAAKNAPSDCDHPPFDPSAPGLEPPEIGPEDEDDEEKECPGLRYERAPYWTPPVPQARAGTAPEAETDWATKPQVLAIGSHFKRLGIGPADQTALLRARFGKFRAERLTRDEAAGLMRSLERGETHLERDGTETAPQGPMTGTAGGRCFTPSSS